MGRGLCGQAHQANLHTPEAALGVQGYDKVGELIAPSLMASDWVLAMMLKP